MATVNIYLNFNGNTEEAFTFYKSVFGGEFIDLHRFSDVPAGVPGMDKYSEADLQKIMHIALKVGTLTLMGTDALESAGQKLTVGNNVSISLNVDSKEEADMLYPLLSEGGKIEMPLGDAFWGAYYAMFTDKFGIQWMINYEYPKQ